MNLVKVSPLKPDHQMFCFRFLRFIFFVGFFCVDVMQFMNEDFAFIYDFFCVIFSRPTFDVYCMVFMLSLLWIRIRFNKNNLIKRWKDSLHHCLGFVTNKLLLAFER